MKDFYTYLIRAKDIAHLSPDAQAREFGIAPNTLKKIERGEPVTMHIFKRVCHAIGKTTKEVADLYPEAFGHGKKRETTIAAILDRNADEITARVVNAVQSLFIRLFPDYHPDLQGRRERTHRPDDTGDL